MNVKAVVKVMNFHSLLRVEASRRQAEKYFNMEDELKQMMSMILSNKNLMLDKKIKVPREDAPVLRIYLGSDFGFCGSVNASVSGVMKKDQKNIEKIVIGKKLRSNDPNQVHLTQEEFAKDFNIVKGYLEKAVKEACYSKVELVYNHFYNSSNVKQIVRKIYPMEETPKSEKGSWDDFILEGDADMIFEDMLILCLICELKIAATSAYASENIMRQNATTESLKKLDEIEEDERKLKNKIRTQISVTKTVDSYVKQKSLEG